MERWRFFLRADKQLDLSNLPTGRQWVIAHHAAALRHSHEIQHQYPVGRGFLNEPTPNDAKNWNLGVQVLRSLAPRVAGFTGGRKATIDPLSADRILFDVIGAMRPELVLHWPGEGVEVKPIRKIRYLLRPPNIQSTATFAEALREFWQIMFASLIQVDGVCAECGGDLGETTRMKRHARCKSRLHRETLPAAVRREREKLKKAKQRAKLREGK